MNSTHNPSVSIDSPRMFDTIGDGFVRAWRAWRGSTQQMAPADAIAEIQERSAELRGDGQRLRLEWLHRVNRLLWVLTSGGGTLVDQRTLTAIEHIETTCQQTYQRRRYPENDVKIYVDEDPRKENLSLQELLLQILGRCDALRTLVHTARSSQAQIEEMRKRLLGGQEEEARLTEALRRQRRMTAEYAENAQKPLKDRVTELEAEVDACATMFLEFEEQIRELRSQKTALDEERRAAVKRALAAEDRVYDLEEQLKRLRARGIAAEKEVKVVVEDPYINKRQEQELRTLKRRSQEQEEELQFLRAEREQVLAFEEHARQSAQARANRKYESEERVEQLEGVLRSLYTKVDELDPAIQRSGVAPTEAITALEELYAAVVRARPREL